MGTQTTVPFAQVEDSGLLGPLQSPDWVKVCLVSTVFFLPVSIVPRVEKCLGLSVGGRVLCLRSQPADFCKSDSHEPKTLRRVPIVTGIFTVTVRNESTYSAPCAGLHVTANSFRAIYGVHVTANSFRAMYGVTRDSQLIPRHVRGYT